jgi:hypothetical protein
MKKADLEKTLLLIKTVFLNFQTASRPATNTMASSSLQTSEQTTSSRGTCKRRTARQVEILKNILKCEGF